MSKEIKVPDLGGAEDVEVIEIYVSEGDEIAAEDSLLAMESDKASMDIPAPEGGRILKLKVKVGDKLNEGDVIAELEDAEADGSGAESKADSDDSSDDAEEKTDDTAEASSEVAEADDDSEAESDDEAADHEDQSDDQETDTAEPDEDDSGEDSIETLYVPDLGDSGEVPVIEISVAVGDVIEAEDSLIVLESDKATMDVPASRGGTVTEILVAVKDSVKKGTPVVKIKVSGGGKKPKTSDSEEASKKAEEPESDSNKSTDSSGKATSKSESGSKSTNRSGEVSGQSGVQPGGKSSAHRADGRKTPGTIVHAGPAVRKMARELGVELANVNPSGPKKRILKDDLQEFVKTGMQSLGKASSSVGAGRVAAMPLPDFSQFGETARQTMSKIHKLTAESMARSTQTIPHVTQFDEADITELEDFRKAQKQAAEKQNTKLTVLPFLIKACAYALKELPQFNASLDMDRYEIVQKQYINIGVAVDTPAGLMVPVLRNVDRKSIWEIARECIDLAGKARDKKLRANDMQGGCFSISSLGAIGGTAFTPIVNAPEVAILGVSRSSIKPVYINGSFEPRIMLPLSLSYDHRAVNGADAARFTALLSELLSDIRHMLL